LDDVLAPVIRLARVILRCRVQRRSEQLHCRRKVSLVDRARPLPDLLAAAAASTKVVRILVSANRYS
jgi:hypothetical protein